MLAKPGPASTTSPVLISEASWTPVLTSRDMSTPEDLGPLVEGKVGGDQNGPALLALFEDLEDVEAFIRSILQCEGLFLWNLWMLAACLRTNDSTYGDVCVPRLGASHSSDSAAETPDCSAPRTGNIFVLRLVRIKRDPTE